MSVALIETVEHQSIYPKLSRSERAFFEILLCRGLLVQVESDEFAASVGGHVSSTKPDFKVINPKQPHPSSKYIEITTHDCQPDKADSNEDPKFKQRAVLKTNGVIHVMLYRAHLLNMQRKNTHLDFDVYNRRARNKNHQLSPTDRSRIKKVFTKVLV